MTASAPERAKVDVVALIASAGGLDALSGVLGDLPIDFPAPIIVQQHLGRQTSILPTILARRSHHEVAWALDGEVLTPGRVAVCPARMQLHITPGGICSLSPLAPTAFRTHDALLTSLADSYGARALAVVLSGSGTDGAAGTTALKNAGGTVIAQSEDTSEYASMPRAARVAGADLVLPLHEIGSAINRAVHGRPWRS
ncbi:MAG: two-component system, chemotaxis family, protein-glutamate methylesterase/glutaminase [Mycobacterium sp.]|jgi:two-component system chemotaxis response regulator CheB|nr:putative CheB methylesterase [Mycobacterium sp.]MDT5135200.1 two-component system, chemotaxis family, protein-glutamate methylesterase/glutaminase [Mycobacterium sp.]